MKILSRTTIYTYAQTGIAKPFFRRVARIAMASLLIGAGLFYWSTDLSLGAIKPPAHWHSETLHEPPESAKKSIEWLAKVIGIEPNFALFKGAFKNGSTAFAVIHAKDRHIVYDQAKFRFKKSEVYWKELGILAHELGHHVAGHTAVPHKDSHAQELEADKFAGYALALLGGNEEQALLWTQILSDKPSRTHPERARRVAAAREGWQQARQLLVNGGLTCHTQWLSESISVEGKNCRIARQCQSESQGRITLACEEQDELGASRWRWRG